MNSTLRLNLKADAVQRQRLEALQSLFSQACNALSPLVQQTRCWNRVALHHMAYKSLRQAFPAIGSQMACNAIYSVCRTSRLVYQSPGSPFNVARLGDKPLPLLRFTTTAPVYFDRHTLSLRAGEISMYTLDGRMRFQAGLSDADEERFRSEKLREIVLTQSRSIFTLSFCFGDETAAEQVARETDAASAANPEWPEYLLVDDAPMAPFDPIRLPPSAIAAPALP